MRQVSLWGFVSWGRFAGKGFFVMSCGVADAGGGVLGVRFCAVFPMMTSETFLVCYV